MKWNSGMNIAASLPIRIILVVILIVGYGCSGVTEDGLKSERDFQREFYSQYFHGEGELEVPVRYGRVDILTNDYAVEVDRLSKFHEGIGQALHYGTETGRQPGLALFVIDPDERDRAKLCYVRRLCELYGIRVWYINDELKMKSGK
jgi:hypothetical protein